jgi:hypothetical protein
MGVNGNPLRRLSSGNGAASLNFATSRTCFPVHDEILANEIVDPLPKTAVAARAAATHYYDSIWCHRAYTEADASLVFN